MQFRINNSAPDKDAFATRYMEAFGKNLLIRPISTNVPVGWIRIILELFSQLRTQHPSVKIMSLHVAPTSSWNEGMFKIVFLTLDMVDFPRKSPSLPRSIKWLVRQAERKALSTCAICGRPIGTFKTNNLCCLCACRKGYKNLV
ncbi:hypothetical protein DWB63_02690 [Pseudodesulfovibrio sp. S3]|nr:hypothetical protein DWB63_02690 [Pseudodesulfovibrio sp. S3]